MPHEIRLPRLGWSMEEGTFVGWLKLPGADVTVGEPLFELEGEKATQEIESLDAGELYIPPDAPKPGSTIPVGALLGYLLAPGEPLPSGDAPKWVAPTQDIVESAPEIHLAVESAAPTGTTPVASPRAKHVANELGVDWTELSGTGRDGRIREADVRAAMPTVVPAISGDRVLLTPRRKAIAERLRTSVHRTIPVTLTTGANAAGIVGLRDQFKATKAALVPAFTDIVACLVAKVLARHPQLAVRWDPQQSTLIAVPEEQYHIGIAVDTPDGLLVPIVRNVARTALLQIAKDSKSLIERARHGKLSIAEMQAGVLTISNLGSYGIDGFTPIINYPEIAVLGLGAVRREAVVSDDDRIVPGLRMTLSLTFDHAAIDGAPAAAFLQDIAAAIENAAAILLGA